jgi:hypothetical protein
MARPRLAMSNWRGVWPGGVNAVMLYPGGRTYFFKDGQYVRYDLGRAAVDVGYPKPISGHGPGVFPTGFNGAAIWSAGRALFFRGTEVIEFDVQAGEQHRPAPADRLAPAGRLSPRDRRPRALARWCRVRGLGLRCPGCSATAGDRPDGARLPGRAAARLGRH